MHLFGNMAPIAEIEALGVPVLEDAAQAMGATSPAGRPGALGRAATFSFYPSKNLGAFGDGGAITTNDDAIAEDARMLRFHGSRDRIDVRAGRLQLAPGRDAGGDPAHPAAARRRLGRRAPRRRRALRRRRARRARAAAGGDRGRDPRVASLRRAPRALRGARRRPQRGRDRGARVLPHAAAPPARDEAVRRRRRAAGDRRAGRDPPRDPDEPGARTASRPPRSSPRPAARCRRADLIAPRATRARGTERPIRSAGRWSRRSRTRRSSPRRRRRRARTSAGTPCP